MEKLKVIPLGGVEEVGKNCLAIEYGRDIIVIDLGFDFPGPDLPGIDYILPDINYLKENKEKIKGIIITHGHLDHIGAIPYYLNTLGNPPLFATPLTLGLIQERLVEVDYRQVIKSNIIQPNQKIFLGCFKIIPFNQVHNIPDSVGLAIETPLGMIIHTGDFKIDERPVNQRPLEKYKLKSLVRNGALALLSDSTNATLPGHSVSEKEVGKVIDQIIKESRGRVIFTTFATLISRIQQVIQACQRYGRKISLVGMSMQKSVGIAQKIGYLSAPSKIFINPGEIDKYSPNKLVILAGGAQGIEGSSMARISENKHWLVRIKRGDTVVFSSSAIPGNELAIHQMMDGLVNQGAKIIYRAVLGSGVHSSGHAFQEELKEMIKITRPKYFIPIEGQHYMQAAHIDLAKSQGVKEENCFMLYNGQILEIDQQQAKISKKRYNNSLISVEGNKVNVLKEEVLKQRKRMASSGICLATICHKIIKIDFYGLNVEEQIVKEVENKLKKLARRYRGKQKEKIKISLSDFILNRTGKKPEVFLNVN